MREALPRADVAVSVCLVHHLAPARYGPLQASGDGKQGIYLTELTTAFAETLAGMIGAEAQSLIGGVEVGAPMQTNDNLDFWEHRLEAAVETDTSLPPTERETIIPCQAI